MKQLRPILLLMATLISVAVQAQKFFVYSVSGGAQVVTTQGPRDIKPWDVLTASATVRIPADCTLRIIDEQESRQYVVRAEGEYSLANMRQKQGNIAVLL